MKMKVLDIIIRVAVCLPLTVVLFPCYAMGYGISKLFRLRDHEDMPTLKEWATVWCDLNSTLIYPFYLDMDDNE